MESLQTDSLNHAAPETRTIDLYKTAVVGCITAFVNVLFIVKYVSRTQVSPWVCCIAYLGMLALAFLGLSKIARFIKPVRLNIFTICSVVIAAGVFVVVIRHIDPLSIKVDRWSAIHNFLSTLFAGQYPYLAKTHLGQYASPLPIMHLLAFPFYLLGDVGYLQVSVFLFTFLTVFITQIPAHRRAAFLLLLLLSPAFLWEVAARSDLFSNMLIFCDVLLLYDYFYTARTKGNPYVGGILSGMVLMTRVIIIIPLLLYFFKPFLTSDRKSKGIFLLAVSCTVVIVLLPFYVWDPDLFVKYNPLILQGNKSPAIMQFTAIVCAVILAIRMGSLKNTFFYSGLIIFILMAATFLHTASLEGINASIFETKFDITYFSTALPFCFFYVLKQKPQQDTIRLSH